MPIVLNGKSVVSESSVRMAKAVGRRLPRSLQGPLRRIVHRVLGTRTVPSPHFTIGATEPGVAETSPILEVAVEAPEPRRSPPRTGPFRLDEITYELFGIDPAEFYRTKFAQPGSPGDGLSLPCLRHHAEYEKVRRLVADLRAALPKGGTVLDVGCASGPHGATLLANVPGIVLHGIDMSADCLEHARANGYSRCEVVDLNDRLPIRSDSYDAVVSMDLFGHIEFRHKDRLVSELARVTRPGGMNHHGVESGYVDYCHCNPDDLDDPVRRYVWVDGHVGAEPSRDIRDRFARHFGRVEADPTFLYPFINMNYFVSFFGEDFQRDVSGFLTPEAIAAGDMVLGRLNAYFKELYSSVFGAAFEAYEGIMPPVGPEHERSRARVHELIEEHNRTHGVDFVPLPRALFRPAGFASITAWKADR